MPSRDLADRTIDAVAKRDGAEDKPSKQPITDMLSAAWVKPRLQDQLGPGADAGSFLRSVLTSIRNAPDLELCDPATILGGIFTAAQLHLEIGPGLGHAYLIPRKARNNDNYSHEASFQLGYPGLLALSYRSGVITGANAELVMVGDSFHRASSSERGPFYDLSYGAEHDEPDAQIMGVLGFFWTAGSDRPTWKYLTIDQVERRRPDHTKQQTGSRGAYVPNTPWKTNYPQMVEKTGLRNVLRFAPKSALLALATRLDDAVLTATRERPDEITAKRDDQKDEDVNLAVEDGPA